MARGAEAVAAFGRPLRDEICLMIASPPFHSVRAVFCNAETCRHHREDPSLNPHRAVREFVSNRGVRVVWCSNGPEMALVSRMLPRGVASGVMPPPPSSANPRRCAESRAHEMMRSLAWEGLLGVGGNGEECPICLDLGGGGPGTPSAWVRISACRHRFHADCILSWLGRNASCPACRCEVRVSETEFIRSRHG